VRCFNQTPGRGDETCLIKGALAPPSDKKRIREDEMRNRGPIGTIAENVVMPDTTTLPSDDGTDPATIGGGRSLA
jgi:hypothetical protein